MLVKLFAIIVCPTLEHGNSVCGPTFIADQRKVEKVQCRVTHCLPELINIYK